MQNDSVTALRIVGFQDIERWLASNSSQIFALVRETYLQHARGATVNPASCFLRFPNNERDRIIALPASIEDDRPISGVKWIASFPQNLDTGLYRASGVLILNDRHSGYPIACLEASAISAARTAASAIVGAYYLHPTRCHIKRLGIVGCGFISMATLKMFLELGWEIKEIVITDLMRGRAVQFSAEVSRMGADSRISGLGDTVNGSDLVLFATTAGTPFIDDVGWFKSNPTVLHVSLRDLGVPVILEAQNIADDVDLCLKAQTSLHLTEQYCGNRSFMAGNIAQVIDEDVRPMLSKPRVFSPFGMGILDLALGRAIIGDCDGRIGLTVPSFLPARSREIDGE